MQSSKACVKLREPATFVTQILPSFWQGSASALALQNSIMSGRRLKCRAFLHGAGHATEDAGIATCCPAQELQKSFTQHTSNRNSHLSQLPNYSFHGPCVHCSPFLFHCGLHANVMSLLTMLVTLNPPFYRFIGCSSLLQGAAQWQWWAKRYESPTSAAAAAGQQSNARCL